MKAQVKHSVNVNLPVSLLAKVLVANNLRHLAQVGSPSQFMRCVFVTDIQEVTERVVALLCCVSCLLFIQTQLLL